MTVSFSQYYQTPVYPAVANKPVTSSFQVQVINCNSDKAEKEAISRLVKQTCNEWEAILEERTIRYSAETEQERKYDTKVSESYGSLLFSIKGGLLSLQPNDDPEVYILMLIDKESRPQGLAKLYHEGTCLKVTTLVSAPWNVPLYAGKAVEHAAISVKGAGTALMRKVYELAVEKGLSKISLKCLKRSEGFYRDHLRMLSDKPRKYYFNVLPSSLPDSLK